jgi:hypothetical protein
MDEELEREAEEAARPNPAVRPGQWPDPDAPPPRPGGLGTDPDLDPETDPDFRPRMISDDPAPGVTPTSSDPASG